MSNAPAKQNQQQRNRLLTLGFLILAKPTSTESDSPHQSTLDHIATLLASTCSITNQHNAVIDKNIPWHESTALLGCQLPEQHRSFSIISCDEPLQENDGRLSVIPGSHYPDSLYARLLDSALSTPNNAFDLSDQEIPGHIIELTTNDILIIDSTVKFSILDIKSPKHIKITNIEAEEPGKP